LAPAAKKGVISQISRQGRQMRLFAQGEKPSGDGVDVQITADALYIDADSAVCGQSDQNYIP
jgi:hypothetical protein